MSPFVVAVVQDAPVVFDSTATLEKVRGLTAEAAGAGAKLVVFDNAILVHLDQFLEQALQVD